MKKRGHTVVPWTPYKHGFAVNLINGIYASDGGKDITAVLEASGEPPLPNYKDLVNPSVPSADMNQLWDVQLQKWNFQCEYLEQWRKLEEQLGRELDAIVAPITPTAAIRHDRFKYYGYASAINLLDFTSVVVPVTFADKALDPKKEDYQPLNKLDAEVQAECEWDYRRVEACGELTNIQTTLRRIMGHLSPCRSLVAG